MKMAIVVALIMSGAIPALAQDRSGPDLFCPAPAHWATFGGPGYCCYEGACVPAATPGGAPGTQSVQSGQSESADQRYLRLVTKYSAILHSDSQANLETDHDRQLYSQLIAKYDALLEISQALETRYNELHQGTESLEETHNSLVDKYNALAQQYNTLRQGVVDYINGQSQGNRRTAWQPPPPYTPEVVCHTEYDGAYGLTTKCQ